MLAGMLMKREEVNPAGDINKDLWILYHYAAQCDQILELGVRSGVSTTAFLAAQPKHVVSVDLEPCINEKALRMVLGRTQWDFIQGDSRAFSYPTGFTPELTFIDTLHTYNQLLSELQVHGQHTTKYILLHDTLSFGMQGEDGSTPGLLEAVRDYIRTSGEWREGLFSLAQNGLTVLQRKRPA